MRFSWIAAVLATWCVSCDAYDEDNATEPVIWEGHYPGLNMTSPMVPICSKGVLGAIVDSVGLNQTLPTGVTIESLLSNLFPMVGRRLQEDRPDLMSFWKNIKQQILKLNKPVELSFLNEENSGKPEERLGELAIDTLGLTAAAQIKGLLPDDISQMLAPLLLFLISPTWQVFLGDLLGHGQGTSSKYSFARDANLFESYAKAVNYAFNHDIDTWRKVCSIQDSVLAFLACGPVDDKFNLDACQTMKPARYEPPADNCLYINSNGEEQNINMISETYVSDPFFPDIRVNNDGKTPAYLETIDPSERVQLAELFLSQATFAEYSGFQYPCNITRIGNILPGWTVKDIFTYQQPGLSVLQERIKDDVPVLAVAQPDSIYMKENQKCDVLILARGTSTTFEWGVDIDINYTPVGVIGESNSGGSSHRGFNRVLNSVFPHLQESLRNIQTATKCDSLRIMITGHSFGGGMATVTAYRLATNFPQHFINVAAFASPNTIDEGAWDNFSRLINSRVIYADTDPIGRGPISKQMAPGGHPTCGVVADMKARELIPVRDAPGLYKFSLRELMGESLKLPVNWLEISSGIILAGKTTNPFDSAYPDEKVNVILINLAGAEKRRLSESGVEDWIKKMMEDITEQRGQSTAAGGAAENPIEISEASKIINKIISAGDKDMKIEFKGTGVVGTNLKMDVPFMAGLAIWLRIRLPLAIQFGLSHGCSYQCLSADACTLNKINSSACTDCPIGDDIYVLLAIGV